MPIDNNMNVPGSIPGGVDSLNRTGAGREVSSDRSALNDNFDWFSLTDGKALPISAQSQFSETATMDEMVGAMLGHLGLV